MDNIYKAVQLTIDSQNLALSKTPTHVYIANQYVDTNDTPLITAPFIIQKALENGTGVVDIVSSTIGSIYEVRLLCDAEVLISGYFYMPPMNVAPHTGAWIETRSAFCMSKPMRVAPHTGAWIETLLFAFLYSDLL